MGMIIQQLAPGMQNPKKARGVTADEFIISGEFFQH